MRTTDNPTREPRPGPIAWAERFPVAALLDGAVPGAGLAAYLERLECADVDDPTLLELVAGWERVTAWAASRQALAVAEMVRRASGSQVEMVADEVAARLGSSRRVAQDAVELATGLAAFPAVHTALDRGELDVRKARVLLTETAHLPDQLAAVLQDAVLPEASHLSAPQLRVALRRVEAARDPGAATVRHERATRDRCVRMVPAPDAMAWIHALLPAADAMTVVTGVDALAAAAAPEDERTVDQRRADALTDLCRRALDAGVDADGMPLPVRQHRRPHLQVTVSAAALLGAARGEPGVADLAGYGPVPLAAVAPLLGQATWRPIQTQAGTGVVCAIADRTYRPGVGLAALVVARDVTCTFPGCRISAVRCDLDHIEPFDDARPAAEQTTSTNLQPLCRHHHRLKTLGRWRVVRDPVTAVTTWHGPGGRTYTRDPVPVDPDVWAVPRRRAGPSQGTESDPRDERQRERPAPPGGPTDGPVPF
ncbi:MAG TPA: DUF222 domain-containing protein [Actinotalea sp.]|nr:DUF222 domain-containing protein [Actinotalea sp.]